MTTWSDDPGKAVRGSTEGRRAHAGLWLATFLHQFRWSLGTSLLSRRALLPAAGIALLLVMQLLIQAHRPSPHKVNLFFAGFQSWAGLSILIPLVSMYLGVSALLDDIEGGSMAYFLSRPAPRPALFLGRTAGAGAAALCFALLLAGASFLGVRTLGLFVPALRHLDLGQLPAFLAAAAAAALCFVALGALLGAITRRGLLWGFALVLGGELLGGALVAQNQVAGLRSILATDLVRQLAATLLPEAVRDGFGRTLTPVAGVGAWTLLFDLVRYLGLCLGAGVFCFAAKEHPYRSRES